MIESRIVIDLRTPAGLEFSRMMIDQGYVRQQNHAVAPACVACRACLQIRVPVATWQPTRSQKRAMRRNSRLTTEVVEPVATQEQFLLFRRYQFARHPRSDMRLMGYDAYAHMVEASPLLTRIVEWRDPEDVPDRRGRLVAAMLIDAHSNCLSLQYSFYEPSYLDRGLGTFMICDMLRSCLGTGNTHVNLGTYMRTSKTLAYKGRFGPHELLHDGAWVQQP